MRVEEYITTRVKELCVKHKVTKYRLSQLTGMSQTALGNIMNMKSMPTVLTLEKICDAFGITMAQFFAGEGKRPDLTQEQKEIIETWDMLGAEERRILLKFICKLDIKNPIIRINTAFKDYSSIEKVTNLPRIYHD